MTLTSGDGKGNLFIGHAACTKIGELLRCLPYEATLDQNGRATRIVSEKRYRLAQPYRCAQPTVEFFDKTSVARCMLSIQTKAGTYVSLTGTADVIKK